MTSIFQAFTRGSMQTSTPFLLRSVVEAIPLEITAMVLTTTSRGAWKLTGSSLTETAAEQRLYTPNRGLVPMDAPHGVAAPAIITMVARLSI